ncbi:MAG: site-specific integrase [Chloroflexi bacterium]|nr:site-specific integrase [Chloroflexota bacterium]
MERCSPAWKPSPRAAVTSYLNSAILPALGHLRVDAVTRADIARWFHHYGQRRSGGANVGHSILRTMFARVIDWGHRPESAGNPCAGIARFRRPPRGRLLGAGDLARLGATLRDREPKWPVWATAVRLILLTGCRPGEIRRLRWCEVKPDRLALIDAKTVPRDVLLGEAARDLLAGLAPSASGEWVFPDERATDQPLRCNALYGFWLKVRDQAGIVADARTHDLRHGHASHAIMGGESLHVTGCLLGHRRAITTNGYAHLDDATLSNAAGAQLRPSARNCEGMDQGKAVASVPDADGGQQPRFSMPRSSASFSPLDCAIPPSRLLSTGRFRSRPKHCRSRRSSWQVAIDHPRCAPSSGACGRV